MINTTKPKQLLLGLLMIYQPAFGLNDYEQIREHIRALNSQEYLIGAVIIDMQVTASHIQGSPPPPEEVSGIAQLVFEQGGPVAQLYYYDQASAPLMSVSSIDNLIPEHITNSPRYFIDTHWLTCPTNTMIRTIRFMQRHGVTHLLVIGSNHNGAIEYMLQEASFNGMHILTYSPFIAETTLLQDLVHKQLAKSLKNNFLYTGIKINCSPDRDDELKNRTAKLLRHTNGTALKYTSISE